MTRWIPSITSGAFNENVGDETLVLVGNPSQVVRLSPEATELLTLIQQNPGNEIEQTPALRQLVDLGVVDGPSTSTLSRRNVLQLSAVAGAVGLSTVLLPTAAMASSSEQITFDATGTYEYDSPNNRWGFTVLSVDFPDEDASMGLKVSLLTIAGADASGGDSQSIGTTSKTFWVNSSDSGQYTGVVIGTLEGGTTSTVYTVGFTESTPG